MAALVRVGAGLMVLALGGCGGMGGLNGYDEFSNYTTRKDSITTSAGDAQAVNAATHMQGPWPAYVGDRRIEGNGARSVKAVECYEKRQGAGSPVTRSQTNTTISAASGTASSQTNSQTKNEC